MSMLSEQIRQPATIFVQRALTDEQCESIRRTAGVADCRLFADQDELERRIEEADIVAGDVSASALARAERLRWIHSWAAGPDAMLYREMRESSVVLTCSKGNGAVPLAEHAMMLMLMLNRNAVRWIDAQREHRWDRFTHGELNGLCCGIIGLGNSGLDLARKAAAFHMKVIGLRQHARPTEFVDEVFKPEALNAFLGHCDFVVVSAPRTDQTRGMLDESAFRAMKPTAYFICFSRGGIADEDALLRALHEGWIAGAGLDAHGEEPLPPDSPFWNAPNTIITPHNGATTHQTAQRGFDIFLRNLKRYMAGEALENVVDKELGY